MLLMPPEASMIRSFSSPTVLAGDAWSVHVLPLIHAAETFHDSWPAMVCATEALARSIQTSWTRSGLSQNGYGPPMDIQ